MTAFDSPLLISKPVCLHARPTANRSFSYSEQRLVSTLLERRRRKYLKLLADSGKNERSNELERKGDRSEIVSNLRVDESSAGSSTELQPRRRLSPAVYETRFRHASIELVSEVMLPTKTRTRAKNLRSKLNLTYLSIKTCNSVRMHSTRIITYNHPVACFCTLLHLLIQCHEIFVFLLYVN